MNKKRRELAYKFSRRPNAQWKDLHWNSKLCGANLLQFIILLVVILPLLRSEVLAQTRIVQAIPTKSFGYLPSLWPRKTVSTMMNPWKLSPQL